MELAEELGTGWRLSCYGELASIAVRADDLAGAAGLVADGEAYLRRTGEQPQLPLFLRAKAERLEAQGRPAEALRARRRLESLLDADVVGSVPFFGPDAVRLAVAEGDHSAAAMLKGAQNRPGGSGPPPRRQPPCAPTGFLDGSVDAFVSAAEIAVDSPRPLDAGRRPRGRRPGPGERRSGQRPAPRSRRFDRRLRTAWRGPRRGQGVRRCPSGRSAPRSARPPPSTDSRVESLTDTKASRRRPRRVGPLQPGDRGAHVPVPPHGADPRLSHPHQDRPHVARRAGHCDGPPHQLSRSPPYR